MVAGPCNHRNRTAGHAIPLAFQSLHRQGRGNHVRRHRAFVITSGRRAKNASDAAGRGWGALPTGHEGPRLDGFSWCPLVTLWSDMVNAESHVQGRCDCLPSPPGDMPYIVCAISCPYLLPARWILPRPRASLPINGLDEPRKIAQRVASGMGRCSPECFVPEHCGPSAPRHTDSIRLPSAVTNLDSENHSVDF